jgi:spermidine/putrescine transport system substrate-binding protein
MKRKMISVMLCMMLLVTMSFTGCGKSDSKVVNVYTFVGYMQEPVISNFEKETGIKINLTEFSTNEEMLAKLQSGGLGQYDVMMCGDYMIQTMLKLGGLIEELDKSKIPNAVNSDPKYLKQYWDPDNTYSLPFMSGYYGICINRDKYPDAVIDSVSDLWDPMYANDMMILDDERADISLALLKLGYDVNEADQGKLDEAAAEMESLKSNIKFFDSSDPKAKLVSEECGIAYTWNSEILRAQNEGVNWELALPSEGVVLWTDNFCIPEKAPHADNAYTFINWVLDGKNHASFDDYLCYGVPNIAATDLLPENIKSSACAYLPDDVLSKSVYVKDVGDMLTSYDEIWTKFKQ